MATTRFAAALCVAEREVNEALRAFRDVPHSIERNRIGMGVVRYVFQDSPLPCYIPEDPDYALSEACRACKRGLDHAYGDSRQHEINPAILERLKNMTDKLP